MQSACTGGPGGTTASGDPAGGNGANGSPGRDAGLVLRTGSQACEPLNVPSAPITLGELVGAGRAHDGTVYVLDRVNVEPRAFVSAGSNLRRRPVLGSGETPDLVEVSLAGAFEVKVELTSGKASRMGIYTGPLDPKTKSFEIGTQGEELTLLGAADLSSFALVDVTTQHLLYQATTADGHRFVGFEPDVDATDDKVRIFYGTADRMLERTIYSISLDSTIHMEIDLDGAKTLVQLDFCLGGAQYFGPTRLEDETTHAQTLLIPADRFGCPDAGSAAGDAGEAGAPLPATPAPDPATEIAGMTFFCF